MPTPFNHQSKIGNRKSSIAPEPLAQEALSSLQASRRFNAENAELTEISQDSIATSVGNSGTLHWNDRLVRLVCNHSGLLNRLLSDISVSSASSALKCLEPHHR